MWCFEEGQVGGRWRRWPDQPFSVRKPPSMADVEVETLPVFAPRPRSSAGDAGVVVAAAAGSARLQPNLLPESQLVEEDPLVPDPAIPDLGMDDPEPEHLGPGRRPERAVAVVGAG